MVVVLLGVEKERDDVDANTLGSDSRDPLSATFILLLVFVFWCAPACVVCVSVLSGVFFDIFFFGPKNKRGGDLSLVRV